MPRQARIDIPGLLQHVIVRGVAQSDIFTDDNDRDDFVRRLGALLCETKTLCYAWALLDNHVHLLLLPTEQTLARLMRRLLTGYAITYNRRHKRAGHLFQNRYKSIVCDDDIYRLELLRYIHLNPLRAGIVADLDALARYPWCGHQQLIGAAPCQLLATPELLPLFAKGKKAAVERYLDFLADGLHANTAVKLSRGGRQSSRAYNDRRSDDELFDERILGGGDFVEQVLGAAELPGTPKQPLAELIAKVADYYKLSTEELSWPCRRPQFVKAKAVICYFAMRRLRLPANAVAARLGYTPSAVSKATNRGEKLCREEEGLQAFLG
jgi:REP element-mobilizing transposase RayT